MLRTLRKLNVAKFYRNRRALAIPATFLILFVSTIGLISVTYYLAVQRVNTQSQTLNVSSAKQDMVSLSEAIVSTFWSPGSASTFKFSDSGGQVNVQPLANSLTIDVSDNRSIQATVFNDTTGEVFYTLPYSGSAETGLYLKGDGRAMASQFGSSMTQVSITNGAEHPEILLRYRPAVSYTTSGNDSSSNKSINNIRIYIVTLNSSSSINSYGQMPLRISCSDTRKITTTYNVGYSPETLLITSKTDETNGKVSIPVSSTQEGAIIKVEIVLCSIQIGRWVN